MPRARLLARVSVVLALSTFAAVPAAAQSPDGAAARAPLEESLAGDAKQAYDAGRALFDAGDWTGATAKFQSAYDLSHDPRLLFDMAVCARDLRAYARMHDLLTRYEQEAGQGLTPEARADVDAALATIRERIGILRLDVSESDASISVDGRALGASPWAAPIVFDVGQHELHVSKAGFVDAQEEITVAGGSDTRLAIRLVAEAKPARLVVVADPSATLVVDHRSATRERFDAALPAGEHEVHVTAPGKKAYDARFDLASGDTRMVRVNLENAPGPLVWPWVAGGTAVVLGAALAAYFLSRPSEQETLSGSLGTLSVH